MMRRSLWLSALAATLPLIAPAQERTRFANLSEALRASAALAGGSGPGDVRWIEGGKRFSYTSSSGDGAEEIRAFDPATGRDSLIFTARDLRFPDTGQPFEYQSFQWSADSKHLVFQTRFKPLYRRSGVADYYVYALGDRSLALAARGARTAELSPDGTMLGYEREGDLFAYDLGARREIRLTRGATETLYHGRFDWVYEEEFGLAQAWVWSPDSRYLAFWQVDESAEPVVALTDFEGRHPEWWRLRIPQPGDSNARVRIGVVEVRSGRIQWLDPGLTGEYYVPRIYWIGRPDSLAMVTLNRPQNEMKLFFFDVRTGGNRLVFTERSDTWIDVYDFYAGVQDFLSFAPEAGQFFWISDRDGWQHIYRYDYSGRLINQVTRGPWSVTRIEGLDPTSQTLYYTSTEASPLQRQLYAVRFDGTGAKRLTQAAGTHRIALSPDGRYYLDRWSAAGQPRQVELWSTAGRKLKTFEDNARVTAWLATHAYSPVELFRVTTSDSARLDASMIKPVPFDSTRRYPVVFDIYGGPGSQQVYDQFATSGWQQWLAQQGYLVVGVNNRASANYGRAFMKAAYRRLGYWEAHDFAEVARYLATLPYVDAARIGIMGTSYGGYATIYTMERYPDLFRVGIANSPVTDWRLYDTIYTERYMGLLEDNLAGYDSSSAVRGAGRIAGRLLLIHSMLDDNVHPQNTMQFLTAAANAGVDVDLRIYPPGRHGAAYNQASALLIRQVSFEYLERYLKGAGR